MILLIILFFALQVLILFCCLAAGNDPYSQQLSDQEQLEFLARWKKEHGREEVFFPCKRSAQKGSCSKEHAAFLAARVLVI